MHYLLLVINMQHVLRLPNEESLNPVEHEFSQFGELPLWQLPQVREV